MPVNELHAEGDLSHPFEAYRNGRLAQVAAVYERHLAKGFQTADFEGQPEPESLQCRDETDEIRWLTLLLRAQSMMGLGFGDQPLGIPIRCTSNRMYAVTYADAAGRMNVLMQQAAAALANSWRLKDLARSAPSREALMQIDLEEGWP